MAPLLVGCEIPGYIASVLPESKIKAVYEPIDQKTLLFVDDPRGAITAAQLEGIVAEKATRDLKEAEAIAEFIPLTQLESLRADEKDFASWPIDQVGRKLGAKQVIYIVIDAFQPGGSGQELQRPMAAARIKVIDVATGKRLFPVQAEHGVTSMLYFKQPPLDSGSRGQKAELARRLAERLGRDIAYQFYDHAPRPVGSGFEDD